MQKFLDARVLKKSVKYFFIMIGLVTSFIVSIIAIGEASQYYFGDRIYAALLLMAIGLLGITYMMAIERVEQERRDEQRLVDKLIRDGEHAEKIAQIEDKYGIKITP